MNFIDKYNLMEYHISNNKGEFIMKNGKEIITNKKQKKGLNVVMYVSAIALGTVIGTSICRNTQYKYATNIESTSTVDNIENTNNNEKLTPIILSTVKEEGTYSFNHEGKDVFIPMSKIIYSDEVLIPKSNKEVIAIQPINPQVSKNEKGDHLSFDELALIYDGESIPNNDFVFTKSVVNIYGVQVYSNDNIIELLENNEKSSIENEQSDKNK